MRVYTPLLRRYNWISEQLENHLSLVFQAVWSNPMKYDGTYSLNNPTELCHGKHCFRNTLALL